MRYKSLKTLCATALCLAAVALPAQAQFNVSVNIGVPPPPPRYEIQEEPRPGFILLPGYWFWDGHQHRWAEHHWVQARPGKHWAPERWEQRGNKHHFEPGRWESDRGGNNGNGRGKGPRENPGRGHKGDDDHR